MAAGVFEAAGPGRPQLEACHHQARDLSNRIAIVSQRYQQVKAISATLVNDPAAVIDDLKLVLQIDQQGTLLPVSWTTDSAGQIELSTVVGIVADVQQTLGGQVVDLWAELHEVTTQAMQICAAARARAAAGGN